MESSHHILTSNRINAYLTQKVREAFPEDFSLIESQLPGLVSRYSLKELILIVRIQLDQLKRAKTLRTQ